jgi:glycosyltransferase involved in cell wall biosynthesis
MRNIHHPLISIALCTYNGERYLKEQIDSILAQTYPSLEIVVVDDCSQDNTIVILEEYAQKVNLRYIVNESNQGFVKSFEKAISLCTGEYLLLSDQDDVWETHKIQTLLDAMENHILVYSNAKLVDEYLAPLGQNLLDSQKINCFSGSNNKAFVFKNCISGNTLMFRHELKDFCLPFPQGIAFHDVWLAFVAATYSSIGYVDQTLISYRQHTCNVTDIYNKRKIRKTFSQKITAKKKSYAQRLTFIQSFAHLKILSQKDQKFFRTLMYLCDKSQTSFISFALLRFLFQHQKELYAINKQIKLSQIIKDSLGIKAYQIFPFI